MNKTLPGGHRMELELDRGPQFKRISGSLLIRGFSFLHTFHIPSYTPRDPEQMEHYVRCVREWAVMWSGMRRPACWRFTDPRRTGLFIPIERT